MHILLTRHVLIPWLCASLLWALAFRPCQAADPETRFDVQGTWLGTLEVGAIKLRVGLMLRQGVDGKATATFVSIDQGNAKLAVNALEIHDQELRFEISNIQGSFEGTIQGDENKIEGTWKQSGVTLPLTFRKVASLPTVTRPQDPREPYPYDTEDVVFPNPRARVQLAGTLTKPRGRGPFPAVILVTGSGPQDRDEAILGHRPFLVLADHLTRQGIAVLRYDDRGIGKSSGEHETATTADFADDALAAFELLQRRDEIDADKIGLAGHSEGGLIAPIVATKAPGVRFVVMLAGTGVPGDQILIRQSEILEKAAGASSEDLATTRDLRRRILGVVKQEKDDKRALEQLTEILAEWPLPEDADDAVRESLVQQYAALLSPWFRHFISYDPRPTLAAVKCPVLALFFEKDVQVEPAQNLKPVEISLRLAGNDNVLVKELPGLNHLMQTCTTGLPTEYAMIDETIAPLALETISSWILETVGKASR